MLRVAFIAFITFITFTGCYGRDYESAHGIWVYADDVDPPAMHDLEQWTESTVSFWLRIYPEWEQCHHEMLQRSWVRFTTEDLFIGEQRVAGKAQENSIQIQVDDGDYDERDRGVFMHELSHVILFACKDIPGTEHHALMEKVQFAQSTQPDPAAQK